MTIEPDPELFADFATLSRHLLDTWELDPQYPMGRWVLDHRGADTEARIWFACLYTNWYRLDSADAIARAYPEPAPIAELGDHGPVWPTKKERRCLRGNDGARRHIAWLVDRVREHGSLTAWLDDLVDDAHADPDQPHHVRRGVTIAEDHGADLGATAAWASIRHAYEDAPYVGSYASYKLCDLLKYWVGLPITAPNMGKGDGGDLRGPLGAIIRLLPTDVHTYAEAHRAIDLQWAFHEYALDHGIGFDGLEETETALCNFQTLSNGNYYVGKDADGFQAQFDGLGPEWWHARTEVLPAFLRGESHDPGWFGVDNHLCGYYERTGDIEWWDPDPHAHRQDSLTRQPEHLTA